MWLLELSVRYSRVHDHLTQEVDDPPEGQAVHSPDFQTGGQEASRVSAPDGFLWSAAAPRGYLQEVSFRLFKPNRLYHVFILPRKFVTLRKHLYLNGKDSSKY